MTQHQEVYNEDCALYVPCSQVQLARVVVRVLVLVDVICVMLVVLIAHVDVVRGVDTVFVAIFCSGRCTLCSTGRTHVRSAVLVGNIRWISSSERFAKSGSTCT